MVEITSSLLKLWTHKAHPPRAVATTLSSHVSVILLKHVMECQILILIWKGSRLLMKTVGLSGNPLGVGIWERHLTFSTDQCNGLKQSN